MRGEIKKGKENFYQDKMPNIPSKQFNAPISVKGIKNMDLSSSSATAKNECNIYIIKNDNYFTSKKNLKIVFFIHLLVNVIKEHEE